MDIEGRTALVTGAARRVGKAIALSLAERGAHVAVHYRTSKPEALNVAGSIRRLGVKSDVFHADLRRVSDVRRMVGHVERRLGPLDILVNCASVYHPGMWSRVRESDWDVHMNANARGPFFCAQAVARRMQRRKRGKIVNITDSDVSRPYRNYLAYLVSKTALLGVTLCLARELAPHVQVNAIAPGAVLLPAAWGPRIKRAIEKATPLGRIGDPMDVARAVIFLIEASDFVTGAVLHVDGGRHLA